MNDDVQGSMEKGIQRRSFFGYLVAAVAGGALLGSIGHLFQKRSSAENGTHKRSVAAKQHPLAIPRSNKGSRSNV